MHYTICLKLISSSGQVALPPAFARLEQRGVQIQICICGRSKARATMLPSTVSRKNSRKFFVTEFCNLESSDFLGLWKKDRKGRAKRGQNCTTPPSIEICRYFWDGIWSFGMDPKLKPSQTLTIHPSHFFWHIKCEWTFTFTAARFIALIDDFKWTQVFNLVRNEWYVERILGVLY